jgi:hypothetical protein
LPRVIEFRLHLRNALKLDGQIAATVLHTHTERIELRP